MRKLILASGVALLAGCGTAPERQNAHQTPGREIDRTPAEIYSMPDYYNNVASKCDHHGHRIFVTSNKQRVPSNIVVLNDPGCGR